MVTAQVVSYGGREFAAGLLWQPLSGSNVSERIGEIKALGKELEINLHTIHREALCVGLVKSSVEVKAGSVSLAAAVADRLNDLYNARDFIFVTEIEGGRWYYLAQKDGIIYSDRDQIVATEDGAKSLLYEDNSIGEWAQRIVPSHWGISGSVDTKSLSELLPLGKRGKVSVNKAWLLAPISYTPVQAIARHGKPLAIIAMAAIVAVVGFNQFKQYQRAKAISDARAAAALIASQQEVEMPRPRPWGEMPSANQKAQACLSTLSGVQLFPGNWELAGVNCTGGVLVVSWKPVGMGWIEHLRSVVPDAVISTDGSLASVTKRLPAMAKGLDEDVFAAGERTMAMYAAAQRYGLRISITAPNNSSPLVLPGQASPNAKPQLWEEMSWKAEEVKLPEVAVEVLNGSGFRLSSMSAQWKQGQFVWTMEGSQYVRK